MYPNCRTAILIDGAFFLKRLAVLEPRLKIDGATTDEIATDKARNTAAIISKYCRKHCWQKAGKGQDGKQIFECFALHRVLFYDCPPFDKKMHFPISGKAIDFSKTPQAKFRNALHTELKKQRKFALRLGTLLDTCSWRLSSDSQKQILKGKKTALTDADFELDIKQKGVDMRLGIDLVGLAYKEMVSQIILIAGDSDFVPAAKVARREGIDVLLDPLNHRSVRDDMLEHIDGIHSYFQKIPDIYQNIQSKP